ncbi:hypothetical protein KQX54_007948 [Cotesia glomerata]|uniref:Uncharacterized protein n=1 Tax=Cotesia glomerata TaxID=32391 RepID=A0AAV7J735_COTGL|nr:hypothetical protein KQX54_007948 [Cotesia glomerata]
MGTPCGHCETAAESFILYSALRSLCSPVRAVTSPPRDSPPNNSVSKYWNCENNRVEDIEKSQSKIEREETHKMKLGGKHVVVFPLPLGLALVVSRIRESSRGDLVLQEK